MGRKFTYCEKCLKIIFPVSFKKSGIFKTIHMKGIGRNLTRVYWCEKCKRFYKKYNKIG